MDARGPLCVGIDPHAALLTDWGLNDDVAGLERFTLTVVEALAATRSPSSSRSPRSSSASGRAGSPSWSARWRGPGRRARWC